MCSLIFTLFGQTSDFDLDEKIPNQSGELVKFYPNPMIKGQSLTVVYQSNEPCMISIQILDVLGNPVSDLEYSIETEGEHKIKILDSSLDPGNYMLKVVCGNYFKIEKLIVR